MWFEDILGTPLLATEAVNGYTKIRETENEVEFRFSPTLKADRANIVKRDNNKFDVTIFKRQYIVGNFNDVEESDLLSLLEEKTDVLF